MSYSLHAERERWLSFSCILFYSTISFLFLWVNSVQQEQVAKLNVLKYVHCILSKIIYGFPRTLIPWKKHYAFIRKAVYCLTNQYDNLNFGCLYIKLVFIESQPSISLHLIHDFPSLVSEGSISSRRWVCSWKDETQVHDFRWMVAF